MVELAWLWLQNQPASALSLVVPRAGLPWRADAQTVIGYIAILRIAPELKEAGLRAMPSNG